MFSSYVLEVLVAERHTAPLRVECLGEKLLVGFYPMGIYVVHTSTTMRKQLICDKCGQSGELLQSCPNAVNQITKVERTVVTYKYVNVCS